MSTLACTARTTPSLHAVVQAHPMPCSVKDADGRYVAVNAAYAELLGEQADALQGRRDEDLMMPWAAREAARRDRVVLSTGQAVSGPIGLHAIDRDAVRICGTSQPVCEAGRIVGVLTCLDPVRAHREASESREQRLLFQVGQVAHDLRSPLAGVIGMARLALQDEALSPGQRQRLQAIETCAVHMVSTLDDLVEIGRIGTARVVLQPTSVAVMQLLDEVVAWCGPTLLKPEVSLQRSLHGADATLCLELDGQRVRQLLLNLVANAARATLQGRIDVRCTLLPRVAGATEDGTRWIRFEVSDSGRGISPDQLARLADDANALELWRDVGSDRRGGLGLLISRRLARALGGELQVRSTSGTGTTVWFDLPAHETSAPANGTPKTTVLW